MCYSSDWIWVLYQKTTPAPRHQNDSQYPSITGSDDEGKRHTGAVLSGSLRGSFKIHRELSMALEKALGWENRHL